MDLTGWLLIGFGVAIAIPALWVAKQQYDVTVDEIDRSDWQTMWHERIMEPEQ